MAAFAIYGTSKRSRTQVRGVPLVGGGGGKTLVAPASTRPPAPLVIEGTLEVDDYSGGFIRLRDTGGVLADGASHVMDVRLATVPGVNGVVIDPTVGVPAGPNPTWFDNGGTLGYVDRATGEHVNQTTVRNWCKYPDDYAVTCRLTEAVDDPSKPLLVIEQEHDIPPAPAPPPAPTPTSLWTKAQILDWLRAEGVDVTKKALTSLTKAELLRLVTDVLNGDTDPTTL